MSKSLLIGISVAYYPLYTTAFNYASLTSDWLPNCLAWDKMYYDSKCKGCLKKMHYQKCTINFIRSEDLNSA